MIQLNFSFSDTEQGWATDLIDTTGNMFIRVELESPGFVVIKQKDGERFPKAAVTPLCRVFETKFFNRGCRIQIITSEQPKVIEYANI